LTARTYCAWSSNGDTFVTCEIGDELVNYFLALIIITIMSTTGKKDNLVDRFPYPGSKFAVLETQER